MHQRVDLFERKNVVVGGKFQRCVLVLAKIDAEYALVMRLSQIVCKLFYANAVESESIDDGFGRGQSKYAWSRIPGLR